jgi:general secretion pathway protein G
MTLVEIIVVLIILVLIGSFLVSGLFGQAEKAKQKLSQLKLAKAKGFIQEYQLQYNQFPQDLAGLTGCGSGSGSACIPVATEEDLKDAWNTPFIYSTDGRSYTIKSLGADKREGGSGADGDISETGP